MRLGVFIYILHRFYTCKAASYAKSIHDHPTSSSFVILKVVKLKVIVKLSAQCTVHNYRAPNLSICLFGFYSVLQ